VRLDRRRGLRHNVLVHDHVFDYHLIHHHVVEHHHHHGSLIYRMLSTPMAAKSRAR
jgi:hypothetical protein